MVLDEVAGTVWYDRIARPAYRNLTAEQADRAAELAQRILDEGEPLLRELDRRSLERRGKPTPAVVDGTRANTRRPFASTSAGARASLRGIGA